MYLRLPDTKIISVEHPNLRSLVLSLAHFHRSFRLLTCWTTRRCCLSNAGEQTKSLLNLHYKLSVRFSPYAGVGRGHHSSRTMWARFGARRRSNTKKDKHRASAVCAICSRSASFLFELKPGSRQPKKPKPPITMVIAVEGTIGVGKLSLMRCLADEWDKLYSCESELIKEWTEN